VRLAQTNDCLAYFDGLQLKPGQIYRKAWPSLAATWCWTRMAATATDAEGRQCSLALYQRLDASGVFYDCCWKTGSTLSACTPGARRYQRSSRSAVAGLGGSLTVILDLRDRARAQRPAIPDLPQLADAAIQLGADAWSTSTVLVRVQRASTPG